MDFENAKRALAQIQIGDPRQIEFEKIAEDVKAALTRGASVKQIVGALSAEFGGDTRWLTRAVGGLRRRRAGRPKKAASTVPTETPAATPAPAPAPRKTLTLSSPARAA